jgi:uncharacterized Tic20 family protein
MTDQRNTPPDDGVIDIPVRIAEQIEQTEDMLARLQQEERETAQMVSDYEKRYSQQPAYVRYADEAEAPRYVTVEEEPKRNHWWHSMRNELRENVPPRHRYPNQGPRGAVSERERLWAALVHANALFTLMAFFSGIVTVVVPLFFPLAVYLYYRKRSQYVAFHALQAFTMQVVGTIGFLALIVTGIFLLVVLIVLSAITIVGIPLAITLALMLVLFVPASFLLPLGMLVYGMIAAYAAWNGRNYRYPYVADWVDDQLNNGFLGVTI